MPAYEKRILHKLLDSYENSLLFTGENKVKVRISYPFTADNIPEYFDESSVEYERIHEILAVLKQKGYIDIVWRRGSNIVQKILLREESIQGIYAYLKREPKIMQIERTMRLLEELSDVYQTPVCMRFMDYLTGRLKTGESVKEYIDLGDTNKTGQLIRMLFLVENNQESCYIREFSIKHFGDSKVLEEWIPLVAKVMRSFGDADRTAEDNDSGESYGTGVAYGLDKFHNAGAVYKSMDAYAILAEHFIYDTPNYVYLKGSKGTLVLEDASIPFRTLKQGIGISGEDIGGIKLKNVDGIKRVITIENLTTFFRWSEEDSILVYLGGYHNLVRRRLLQIIFQAIPDVQYLHFGDIDAGGFEIYEDLCKKTGIPFQLYHMDLETLICHKEYAKKLTLNDRKRIEKLKEQNICYQEVLDYMLIANIKLEQECIEVI